MHPIFINFELTLQNYLINKFCEFQTIHLDSFALLYDQRQIDRQKGWTDGQIEQRL